MKAADLDDLEYLRNVDELQRDGLWPGTERRWVFWWELEPVYPDVPRKVVAAKFRQLNKRGLLDGCTCGCRGDLQLTPAALALIGEA